MSHRMTRRRGSFALHVTATSSRVRSETASRSGTHAVPPPESGPRAVPDGLGKESEGVRPHRRASPPESLPRSSIRAPEGDEHHRLRLSWIGRIATRGSRRRYGTVPSALSDECPDDHQDDPSKANRREEDPYRRCPKVGDRRRTDERKDRADEDEVDPVDDPSGIIFFHYSEGPRATRSLSSGQGVFHRPYRCMRE